MKEITNQRLLNSKKNYLFYKQEDYRDYQFMIIVLNDKTCYGMCWNNTSRSVVIMRAMDSYERLSRRDDMEVFELDNDELDAIIIDNL